MLELTVYPISTTLSVLTSADVRGRYVDRRDPTSPLRVPTLLTWVGPWRLGLLLGAHQNDLIL